MVVAVHVSKDLLFPNSSFARSKTKTADSTIVRVHPALLVSKDIVWITEADVNMLTNTALHLILMVFATIVTDFTF